MPLLHNPPDTFQEQCYAAMEVPLHFTKYHRMAAVTLPMAARLRLPQRDALGRWISRKFIDRYYLILLDDCGNLKRT